MADMTAIAVADPWSGSGVRATTSEQLVDDGLAAYGAGKSANAEAPFRATLDRDPGLTVTVYVCRCHPCGHLDIWRRAVGSDIR
jgi:hypothetical protein